ncbi:MAG TPA: YtxH domain-containing protein [Clostridiaceae bacterium]|nr:YtxH domain-containing protein [Clostridiaceae bacterium]
MNNGFTKGLIIGGLIGASVSMVMSPGGMKNRTRKKMMRTGRAMMRKSGNLIADMIDVFR